MNKPESPIMGPIEIPDFITEEIATGVFEELEGISVELALDPTVLGPSYVHSKLATCRRFSIRIESLLVTFYNIERGVKNLLESNKEILKAQRAELLALNDWVGKGRSAADREARVSVKMKNVILAITDLKEQLLNVGYVLRAIELKREGLNRTNNDIKKQVHLMEVSKDNSTPIDEEADEPTLQEEGDDVTFVFDMPIEKAPEVLDPNQEKHMSKTVDSMEGTTTEEDLDSFLSELDIQVDLPVTFPGGKSFAIDDEPIDMNAFLSNMQN